MNRLRLFSAPRLKFIYIAIAAAIAVLSLYVGNLLVKDLIRQEEIYMNIWAESMRTLVDADSDVDLNLVLKVIHSNSTIPVIASDNKGEILAARNVGIAQEEVDAAIAEAQTADAAHWSVETQKYMRLLKERAADMRTNGKTMRIPLAASSTPSGQHLATMMWVHYESSLMLRRLMLYPYFLWGVVIIFAGLCLLALLNARRAEQNKLWVGLSRETAHQLGTPISSLLAASEYMHLRYPSEIILPEIDKDIRRLRLIADRFSKIGSPPDLCPDDLCMVVKNAADYMARRIPKKVGLQLQLPETPAMVMQSAPLLEWVVENLFKNAVDAMEGAGTLTVWLLPQGNDYALRIADTGKGIPRKHWKKVFQPGFTTKKRGWGLGLSLAKRIINEFHGGKLFIEHSEMGVGTTFCILLPQYSAQSDTNAKAKTQ